MEGGRGQKLMKNCLRRMLKPQKEKYYNALIYQKVSYKFSILWKGCHFGNKKFRSSSDWILNLKFDIPIQTIFTAFENPWLNDL